MQAPRQPCLNCAKNILCNFIWVSVREKSLVYSTMLNASSIGTGHGWFTVWSQNHSFSPSGFFFRLWHGMSTQDLDKNRKKADFSSDTSSKKSERRFCPDLFDMYEGIAGPCILLYPLLKSFLILDPLRVLEVHKSNHYYQSSAYFSFLRNKTEHDFVCKSKRAHRWNVLM